VEDRRDVRKSGGHFKEGRDQGKAGVRRPRPERSGAMNRRVLGARSERSLYEYDCSTNRFRVVQQELYSDAMATGHRLGQLAVVNSSF